MKIQIIVSIILAGLFGSSEAYALDFGKARTRVTSEALSTAKKVANKKNENSVQIRRAVAHMANQAPNVMTQVIPSARPLTVGRYGKPYRLYARRTNYTHDRRPETYIGKNGKKKKDWWSARGQTSTGPRLREATNHSPAVFAVSTGNKGDILVDLSTGEIGINADTVGTTKAASINKCVVRYKVKKHGHIKVVKRVISLHKTLAQIHAPVVDECKNRPLNGPEYGNFLVIPRIDPRPFRKLTRSEQESEIAAGFMAAKWALATYSASSNVMMATR